jgi:hypothetical protein
MRKKSSRERLLDSLNSIVKKERVHCEKKEKFRVEGFVIARILSWKEEEFVKRLRDSQRLRESLKSHRQRDSHRKA